MSKIDKTSGESEDKKSFSFGPPEVDTSLTRPKDDGGGVDLDSIWAALGSLASDMLALSNRVLIIEEILKKLVIKQRDGLSVDVSGTGAIDSTRITSNTFRISVDTDEDTISQSTGELVVQLSICP